MENSLQITSTSTLTTTAAITEELYRRFISFCDAKPQTIKTYTAALQTLFGYLHTQQISRPDTDDIIRYKSFLLDQYKAGTVSLYMTACRLFFRWTAQRGYYPNIADHIKGAKINRLVKKRDALTSTQIKTVLANINRETLTGKRDYAILAIMTACGLRDIEVSRANIEDLRNCDDCTVIFVQGKGRDEKEPVTVSPSAERAIRAYLTARGEMDGKKPLFVSASNHNNAGRLTTRSISRIVKGHLIQAGYNSDTLTAHSLRHTMITLTLKAGNSIETVREFARHADLATTDGYNHNITSVKTKMQCSNAIEAAIFGV